MDLHFTDGERVRGMVPLVGDRGAGGVAVCLFAGGAGFVLQEGSWV